MEDPVQEILSVVQQLTTTDSPYIQKATLETYMTPDVEFRHPVCAVDSEPNSRESLLGIYRWARVLSPRTDINIESIVFDEKQGLLYLESVQWFKLFFLPIKPAPARLITRLSLRKRDGLYYISKQEDFYHPEDFAALLLPASAPFIRLGLTAGTVLSNILIRAANVLGFWRLSLDDTQRSSPPSEVGLYDKED